MNTSSLTRRELLALSIAAGTLPAPGVSRFAEAQASDVDRYWEWGWGTYDASADERNIAVFDWSFIHVGYQVNNIGRMGDGK